MKKTLKNSAGLSLIELMLSMTIGVFLVGGLATVYVSSRSSDSMRNEVSTMEENARVALMSLRQIISHAGYPSVYNLPVDQPFYAESSDIPNPDCRGGGGKKLVDYDPILDEKTLNNHLGGRDTAVVVTMADNLSVSGATSGHIFADCINSDVPPECSSDPVAGIYNPSEARIYNYLYINTREKRRALTCMGSRGGAQPLAENIENMQFLYGVSKVGEVQYQDANTVTAANDWGNVISVQVGLLVRSEKEILPEATRKTFRLLDENISTPKDRRLYRVYATTIVLPNRAKRGL